MSMSENSPAFRFAVLTLFPEAFAALTEWGVTGRAFQNGLCQLHLQDPRRGDRSTRAGDDSPWAWYGQRHRYSLVHSIRRGLRWAQTQR